jgi:hypothetical protein
MQVFKVHLSFGMEFVCKCYSLQNITETFSRLIRILMCGYLSSSGEVLTVPLLTR